VGACDGCLGDEKCWVCLANGLVDSAAGMVPCHRCFGSGRCPWCQEIKIVDIEQPPLLRVGPFKLTRRRRSA
jgi:hypothetical protein